MKFSRKNIENWRSWEISFFFLLIHFEFCFVFSNENNLGFHMRYHFSQHYAQLWARWSHPFDPSLLSNKLWQNLAKWPTKKSSFSISANSQYFFVKISWIYSMVSRIDWCKGHWWCSTYMVVRLSDIGSKTGKKGIFCTLYVHLF